MSSRTPRDQIAGSPAELNAGRADPRVSSLRSAGVIAGRSAKGRYGSLGGNGWPVQTLAPVSCVVPTA